MFAVLHVLGQLLLIFSITYVMPLATSFWYADGLWVDYLYAAAICLAAGAALSLGIRRFARQLRSRDGFLLVTLAGPGLGVVGPASNFQGFSDFQTWICSAAMLLGRLEIFSVVVLFTPAFWRK